ncbi:MAG: hypothetical protein M8353_12365, partial [ANME-2 cluster archaeon]|nr:hypothetical protein [ANME-2 cluster archaeon]
CHSSGTPETVEDCDYCHNNATPPEPATQVVDMHSNGFEANNTTSHHNCTWCHYNLNNYTPAIKSVNGTDIPIYPNIHNIYVPTTCTECHPTPPTNHSIKGSEYGSMSLSGCLACHGSAHSVALGVGGDNCVGCHYNITTADLGLHSSINGTSDVDNGDCTTCHYNNAHSGTNVSNTYYCADCHTATGTGPANSTIQFTDKLHGKATCVDCHVEEGTYHNDNPRGSVANLTYVNRYNAGSTTVTNCADCHYASNLDDAPFHAPGAGGHILTQDDGTSGACVNPSCHAGKGS